MGFLADPLEHVGDFRPAAVDHHHPDAHQAQEDNVADDRLAQLLGNHGIAAVFDHHGLAAEVLNIGQGLGQHLRPVNVGV
ncbi:hypothetical protein SDC9_184993 [bioreactor metagenome]|uniref:Uncharacterized protein n=1 Tax=bioreactor metagenome TaxID=1076179 RepID=A0A645HMZ0_9ZZZZ